MNSTAVRRLSYGVQTDIALIDQPATVKASVMISGALLTRDTGLLTGTANVKPAGAAGASAFNPAINGGRDPVQPVRQTEGDYELASSQKCGDCDVGPT